MPIRDQHIKQKAGALHNPMNLLCFYCIVNMQNDPQENYPPSGKVKETAFIGDTYAVTIYQGNALCLPHLNTTRGWDRNYDDVRAQYADDLPERR